VVVEVVFYKRFTSDM